jgi:hypothetical protein
MADPTEYLVARLHEALTHDPRVHDQSLEVRVEGDRVVLRGELATPERCEAAIAVAKELFPDATVVADLRPSPERPAPEAERL